TWLLYGFVQGVGTILITKDKGSKNNFSRIGRCRLAWGNVTGDLIKFKTLSEGDLFILRIGRSLIRFLHFKQIMNIKKALPFLILLVWTLFSCSPKGYDVRFFSIGDMPYHLPDDLGRFDRVISSLNHERPAFTVHVGDFKTGSSPCDEAYFLSFRGYFQQFQHPLFYTPGDNEWTDCHRIAAGGYDPIERLAKVRELFYTDTGS